MIARTIFLALICLLSLSACTTEMGRAEKYFENGAYDDAIASYEKVLSSDKKNEDAKIGLIKARAKWIEAKLIEVRMLRMSGNTTQSLELLAKIYSNEFAWNQMPMSPASFTQEEETEMAAKSATSEIQKRLKAGLTLGALEASQKYAPFYQGRRSFELTNLSGLVKTQGQTDCSRMSGQIKSTDYYYGLFTQKYCQYFGGRAPDLKSQASRETRSLYRGIKVVYSEDTDLPEETRRKIEDLLQNEFQNSVWFDPAGKNLLELNATGHFVTEYTVTPKTLIHSYEVTIPYQETHTETKQKPKPQQASSTPVDNVSAALGALSAISTVASGGHFPDEHDNGDGTVTVTITETKYRQEPRTFSYNADEHEQVFKANFSARGVIAGEEIVLALDRNARNVTVSHNNNVPDVGLYPKEAKLWNDQAWLRDQIQGTSFELKNKVQAAWSHRYCSSATSENNSISANDRIFRCLRIADLYPANTQPDTSTDLYAWFGNTLGITPVRAYEILGKF